MTSSRWHRHRPLSCSAAWASQTPENIPVIMAFQCHVACWVWPEPWDWQCRDNMFVKFSEFIGKGWSFWHTSLRCYLTKLVCASVLSVRIYFHPKPRSVKMLQKLRLRRKLQLHYNIGRKSLFSWTKPRESSHFPPFSLKMAFPILQLSGGNPFSGPS